MLIRIKRHSGTHRKLLPAIISRDFKVSRVALQKLKRDKKVNSLLLNRSGPSLEAKGR